MVEWWSSAVVEQWRLCSGLYNLCPARADTGDTAGLGWERSLELSKFYIDIGGPYSQYLDMASTRAFTLRIFFYEMAIKTQSLHLKLALFPSKIFILGASKELQLPNHCQWRFCRQTSHFQSQVGAFSKYCE